MGEKGRPWKKVVPEQQYRMIEAILYQYSEMVRTVAEWRENAILGSRKRDDGMPKGHAHISDPTSIAAIRLENPPDSIASKIAWIDVVTMDCERSKTKMIWTEHISMTYAGLITELKVSAMNARTR